MSRLITTRGTLGLALLALGSVAVPRAAEAQLLNPPIPVTLPLPVFGAAAAGDFTSDGLADIVTSVGAPNAGFSRSSSSTTAASTRGARSGAELRHCTAVVVECSTWMATAFSRRRDRRRRHAGDPWATAPPFFPVDGAGGPTPRGRRIADSEGRHHGHRRRRSAARRRHRDLQASAGISAGSHRPALHDH